MVVSTVDKTIEVRGKHLQRMVSGPQLLTPSARLFNIWQVLFALARVAK